MDQQIKSPTFSHYIYILYKWRKFLIINLLIIGIAAAAYAFTIPETFKATATVMIPPESSLGLGSLAGLVSGKSSAANLGSKLLGMSGSSEDVLFGILNSRSMLSSVVAQFGLMNYYEIEDNNMDKALKAFRGDLSFDMNEYSMIEISVINRDPVLSAEISNFFIRKLDSANIALNIENARNNRLFIEKRYIQNLVDLRVAEDSLHKFQKKYGIVAVPEQLEVAIKAAAEIEAELAKKEVASRFIKEQYGENSPHYQGILAEVNILRSKVLELKQDSKFSEVTNVLFPFKDMPDMSMDYLRKFRDLEVQQTIMEFVLPLYEQAKIEEQKSIPTISIIDEAVPPQLKYRPQKMFIISAFLFLALFIFLPLVYRMESITNRSLFNNLIEEKESRSYSLIKKLYWVK